MAAQERLTLRNLYLYLVCLFTLVISIFAAVNLVRGTVELLYPDPGYYSYASVPGDGSTLSKEEERRQEETARDSQRRQSVLSLVGAGTTLLFAGPIYLYHWRRVQKELPTPQPEPDPVPS